MLLRKASQEIVNSQDSVCRIIVGAGAVGLFLANIIKTENPLETLIIISKSKILTPIYIQYSDGRQVMANLPLALTPDMNFDECSQIKSKNIYFYVTTPPEYCDHVYKYIYKIAHKFSEKKIIFIVFMNNGFVDYKSFIDFKHHFNKNKRLLFYFVRALVVSGFMREKLEDKTIIKNTAGNKIYYGFYKDKNINTLCLFPKLFYESIYDKNIFLREKTKFFTNFMLGLVINKNLLQNEKIYTLISEKKIEESIRNYCLLFTKNELNYDFVREQFYSTIEAAGANINSISFAWHFGDKNTMDYFVIEFRKLLKKNKKSSLFFEELINEYYQK
ncbi:hypothetical protein [Fluviispira multicolorata]|uniref:Uncharacterized protein n=1 Tax=Fluviispira multicolorata TaxID=2654512 RepID=A0A833N3I1_9BACT|nr:hypothetical protein [Fluviispira multicolorata]KAB8028548.1 hypothetical protein GCL57_12555 [Fluviispira multicolorata]